MSPIGEKLNSSLHKLGDKLKRARSSEVIDTSADIKKPRSHPRLANGSLVLSVSDPPSTNSSLELINPGPRPVGSASNPIASMSATPATTVTDRPGEDVLGEEDRDDQLVEDSKLARALQYELNHEHELASPRLSQETTALDADLRSYLVTLDQKKCPKCRAQVPFSCEQVVARTKMMLRDEGVLHPYIQCKKCKVWICMGCDAYSDRSLPPYPNVRSGAGFKVAWCCDRSRLFLIWSVACGPEFHKSSAKQKDSVFSPTSPSLKYRLRNRTKSVKLSSSASQDQEAPTGPEEPTSATPVHMKGPRIPTSRLPKGTGYGGHEGDPLGWSKKRAVPESKPLSLNRKRDDQNLQSFFGLYFRAMKLLLPSVVGKESARFVFPAELCFTISALLPRSPLLPKASEVLRNDSVDEMSEQKSFYDGLLDFMEAMGNHNSTLPLLVRDFFLYPREDQLVHVSLERDRLVPAVATIVERSQSLLSVLQNLATQCHHLALASSAHLQAFGDEQEKALLVLLNRITQTYETLESNLHGMDIEWPLEQRPGGWVPGIKKTSEFPSTMLSLQAGEDALQSLAQWHREHSVDEIPDEKLLETHTYAKSAKQMRSNGVIGRMKKLVTQVASLRTSLPGGIFVRHCSSRLDVMKVLITGPEGTPYENGLFEFDLFCPTNFPSSPPLMQFRTTGGGSVRFNPNLYECGKVCLSLLGTWSGQKWTEQSTILQVLVSIQAMIFTDKPWYNEPGRERVPDQAASDRYNSQVQGWTLQHAILYWLNERLSPPPNSDRCLAARVQSSHTKHEKGRGPLLKLAKTGPEEPPIPKLNSFSPFFDLMDDKPTKPHPKQSAKQSAPSSPSQSAGAKWWQVSKSMPEPSPPHVQSSHDEGDSKLNVGQSLLDEGSLFGPDTKLSKQANLSQSAYNLDGSVPTEKLGTAPPESASATNPSHNPQWMKGVSADGTFDTFGPYASGFPEAGLDELLLTPDMEEATALWQQEYEHELLNAPDRMAADTNTRIDSNDDYVWGDVVRKHFEAKAKKILKTASEWRTTGKGKLPEDPILLELEEAMVRHGFVLDRKRMTRRGTVFGGGED